ncbi:hypothetical protein CRYUN_Cryun06bG0009100 [Craigia yunnanensis]
MPGADLVGGSIGEDDIISIGHGNPGKCRGVSAATCAFVFLNIEVSLSAVGFALVILQILVLEIGAAL